MDIRSTLRRWLSPALFALIALCFFLPFATVWSSYDADTTFAGIQLVTHSVPHSDPSVINVCSTDISACVERRGSGPATVAFAAALVGLLLGLLGIARGPGWCAAVGLGSLIAGLTPLYEITYDITWHVGYDLAPLLFTAVGALHLVRALRRWKQRRRALRPDVPPAGSA